MRQMGGPHYGDAVVAWPVGIDTETWERDSDTEKTFDVLLLWQGPLGVPEARTRTA